MVKVVLVVNWMSASLDNNFDAILDFIISDKKRKKRIMNEITKLMNFPKMSACFPHVVFETNLDIPLKNKRLYEDDNLTVLTCFQNAIFQKGRLG